jgi:hypothetical protein
LFSLSLCSAASLEHRPRDSLCRIIADYRTFISMSVVRDGRFCRHRGASSATAEMPIALMCGAFFVYYQHLT